MMTTSTTRPSARTFAIEDIVDLMHRGAIRIPAFQRGIRWQWEDVRRLFDSIVRGYPIGSLLLWKRQSEAERIRLGRLEIDAPAGEALWVVDGQQRLTSLANALSDAGAADDRYGLVYDVEKEEFLRPGKSIAPYRVPLPVVFDLQSLLRWTAKHFDEDRPELFDRATGVAKAIRQFNVPAYVIEQQDESVLRDIFDRMNNYGKRLTRAEVFTALNSGGNGTAEPAPTLTEIAENVDGLTGFGRIDDDTVLRAVLARRGGDVAREIRHEFSQDHQANRDFGGETTADAYRGGEEALLRAVRFIQSEAGVPHFFFLPYRYLIVVLTRFFAHHPDPIRANARLLRRWFWRAALIGPKLASGNWTGTMRSLAQRIVPVDESDSVQRLLGALGQHGMTRPRLDRFRTNQAETRVVLCALWSLEPRSLDTGLAYDKGDLAEALRDATSARDIAGRIVVREPADLRGRAANRFVDLGASSEPDFTSESRHLADQAWDAVLRSHALDTLTVDLLRAVENDGRDEVVRSFLDAREAHLGAVLDHFVATMAESSFEDTRPLDEYDLDESGERDDG